MSVRLAILASALCNMATIAHALPSFARQMDMQCTECHTEFPILNQFGRNFKLGGYTSASENPVDQVPLAFMLLPSYTHTAVGQAGGAAPGFGDNNNYAMTQASIFYAGRIFGTLAHHLFGPDVAAIANRFGVFGQATYNGISKKWNMDNTEFRYADKGEWGDRDLMYGFYWNNNPTLQDPWNGTPAFGYPFTGSGLAPTPAASSLIEGALAGTVGGLGGYVMINDHLYLDVAGYKTLPASLQKRVGIDPAGETELKGIAPYWRLAYDQPAGQGRLEIGTFGMTSRSYPGRDKSSGTDTITDFGFDAQYQQGFEHGDFTLLATWIHEMQTWNASSALGNTDNLKGNLDTAKLTGTYLFDKTYGFTAQYFYTMGSTDAALYSGSASGSPSSSGFIVQADWLPFNKKTGPKFWPRSNVKFTVQYRHYNKFDGASTNYDGNGANASDNNTLYLEAWIVF